MVDRSVSPEFSKPSKFDLPGPQIHSLGNGGKLYALNIGSQPVVKVEFIFKAGIWYEPSSGISFFTAKMLQEGTSSYSSREIADKLDQFGAFLEISSGFDYSNLSIYVPVRHWDNIAGVVKEILYEPAFEEEELRIAKQLQIQQLNVNLKKNDFIASRKFRSRLFQGSPYGHTLNEEEIRDISADKLGSFYKENIFNSFDVFVTGQLDDSFIKKIKMLVDRGAHNKKTEKINQSPEVSHFNDHEDIENSLQSSIFMGGKCINRSHEKYPEMLLLNEVFGGYFGSRLMQNIREEKGYTYGIYSHIASMKNDSYFYISSDVKKEFKEQTLSEIQKEIDTIKNEPIDPDELLRAKNYLKGSLLNSMTNQFAVTEKLKNIYLYNLGFDFYDKVFDGIDAVDSNELLALANNLLFSEPLSTVVVG